MLNLGDLAASLSTRYEVLFQQSYNQSVAVEQARLAPLIMPLDLPDFQGDTVDLNWLGAAPQMRQWVDEKRAVGIGDHHWAATVVPYEATIEIDLNDLKDAKGNIYEPRIQEMGVNAARHDYNMISDLLVAGTAALCYDGQFFFDNDHSEGDSGVQDNLLAGSGVDTLAHIRADYYAGLSALNGFKDDKGIPIAPGEFRPLVWVPNAPGVLELFEQLQAALLVGGGDTNVLAKRFDLVVDPRLTDLTDWYMFRTSGFLKPIIIVYREKVHYEDNFSTGHPDVWSRRIGQASIVGRMIATYGMWQQAVKVVNA